MDVSRSALFEAKIHVYVVMLCFAVQARRQVEAQALKPKPCHGTGLERAKFSAASGGGTGLPHQEHGGAAACCCTGTVSPASCGYTGTVSPGSFGH
jgi:hypothetical protein